MSEVSEVNEVFRVRVKVYTDEDGELWMCASAMLDTRTAIMTLRGMRDNLAKLFKVSVDEWNEMPFHFFDDAGIAPRPGDQIGGQLIN